MISLKKYLETSAAASKAESDPVERTEPVPVGIPVPALKPAVAVEEKNLVPATIAAYRSALLEMGSCSLDACPALGNKLKNNLNKIGDGLSVKMNPEQIEAVEKNVQQQLEDWGRGTAKHYREKTGEVREILLVMARTAESVGERDFRCAGQLNEVTLRLEGIASLDDLTEIRASIERNAAELKSSIERMTSEGKAAMDQLRAQVSMYQVRMEEAEEIASKDALTGVRSRLCTESQLERRIAAGTTFCAAIIDIESFKKVNDEYGHVVGDELLKQFATELTSACRSTDTVGRWGGDEFIILLDSGFAEAKAQTDRLRQWICGNYTVATKTTPKKLRVEASIGLAEHQAGESMKELLARADAAMYQQKAASHAIAYRR